MNRHGSTKINRGFIAPFLLTRLVHYLAAIWHNLSPPLTPSFWNEKGSNETQSEIAACNTKKTPHKLNHQMSGVLH
jgi:hypothetical protein